MNNSKHLILAMANGSIDNPLAKNEIPLYSPIYSWVAESFVREVNTFPDDSELTIRINTPGGQVTTGYAMISRLSDREGAVKMYVDGIAYSMAAYMLLYSSNNVGSENSRYMFHKAAYPSYYEPNDAEQQELKRINAEFKTKMKSKLKDIPETKELISKVFESDVRNDVYLSAKEAKKIGLIHEIKKLDKEVKAYMDEQVEMLAFYTKKSEIENNTEKITNIEVNKSNKKESTMDVNELKSKHPDLYSQVFNSGVKTGVENEKDRVGAFLPYLDAAPEAVKKAISGDSNITETQRSEFAIALVKQANIKAEETEKIPPVNTAEDNLNNDAKAQKEKELDAMAEKNGLTLKA